MSTSSKAMAPTTPTLPREIIHQIITCIYTQHGSGWDHYTSAAALRELTKVSRVLRDVSREIWSTYRGVYLDCFAGPGTHPFFDLYKSPDCSFVYPFAVQLELHPQSRLYHSLAAHEEFPDQCVERFFVGLGEASPRVRTLHAEFRKPHSLRSEYVRTVGRVMRKDVRKVTVVFNGDEEGIFVSWVEELGQCIQLEELDIRFSNPYAASNVPSCVSLPGSAPSTLRILHLSIGLESVWIPLLDWIEKGGRHLSVLYIGLAVVPSAHCRPDALLVENVLAHLASGCIEELYLSATPISVNIGNLPPSVTTIHIPLYMNFYRGDDDGRLAGAVGTLASLLHRRRPAGMSSTSTSFNPLIIRLSINSPNFRAEKPNLASQIRMLDECLVDLLRRTDSPITLCFIAAIQDPEAVGAFVAEWLPELGKIASLEDISPVHEECHEWTMGTAPA